MGPTLVLNRQLQALNQEKSDLSLEPAPASKMLAQEQLTLKDLLRALQARSRLNHLCDSNSSGFRDTVPTANVAMRCIPQPPTTPPLQMF